MSDGTLSQDEIDSLLAGLDPGTGGGAPAPRVAQPAQEIAGFRTILDSISPTQEQNLSMITGQDVSIAPLQVDQTTRDGVLPSLPDEVLAVRVDIVGGIPGDHLFLFPKDTALRIASLASHDETMTDLDEMAISAVSECVSNMTGTEITVIAEKTGNRSVQSGTAEGNFGPKAIARFPAGDFVRASYDFSIAGQSFRMWELFSLPFVRDIVAAAGMGGEPAMAAPAAGGMMGGMGGGGMGGQMGGGMGGGMGGQQQMGYPQPSYQQPMMGMGQAQGGYQTPVMGMAAPNVQPVQFANLGMSRGGQESGNIGLIMDVYMELTVELGRTKRLIKDILGIGEGTILELDKLAGEPVDILVNHKLIAKGEVVVIDENFGVRVTEIVSPMERMPEMS